VKNLTRIVESVENVALLGGGAAKKTDLELALTYAPRLFCADGGGDRALDWAKRPEKVIGDMDSVDTDRMESAGVELVRIADQNSTDFEKCLGLVSAPLMIGVGFLGGRLDHQLAVLNGLAKHPAQPVVLIGEDDVCFLCPKLLQLDLPEQMRVSLFPLTPARADSCGLLWPLDGLDLSPTGQIATSNAARTGGVSIRVLHGDLVCILPKECLAEVVSFFID